MCGMHVRDFVKTCHTVLVSHCVLERRHGRSESGHSGHSYSGDYSGRGHSGHSMSGHSYSGDSSGHGHSGRALYMQSIS